LHLAFDAVLGRMLFQLGDCESAKPGEIRGQVTIPGATLVFVEWCPFGKRA